MLRIIRPEKAIAIVRDGHCSTSLPDAEVVAIKALQFLAGRVEELERFLALSGVDPTALRRLAHDPAFLGGVLDFLLSDEALLLAFASDAKVAPESIAVARQRLDRGRRPLDSGEG